ncbi:uncharacterized protein PHALS_11134 [Plasmopara halstedii]|uniref:Uncharacterized protein n=1 Tax=Plasmopara halstedii TaxID=4781 RepID=A0A0P1AIE5_PLAHL|nr:uncharacterized protein PHALS_11134 [Plasmopara halstedii]CEG40961.1 hypothetical protein PHALS_11134 [Plasmopara halstedii]|eukprot:XP_024577330.1 hypothetical protein PHALS_11134 [Plasmopara halstedii]
MKVQLSLQLVTLYLRQKNFSYAYPPAINDSMAYISALFETERRKHIFQALLSDHEINFNTAEEHVLQFVETGAILTPSTVPWSSLGNTTAPLTAKETALIAALKSCQKPADAVTFSP